MRSARWKNDWAWACSTAPRAVALTEAGQRLAGALAAGAGAGDALEEMNHFRAAPAGLLRLNATRAAVATQLRPRLARFLHAHPDVRVELTENDGLVDIVAEGYDAGVRLHEFVPEDHGGGADVGRCVG